MNTSKRTHLPPFPTVSIPLDAITVLPSNRAVEFPPAQRLLPAAPETESDSEVDVETLELTLGQRLIQAAEENNEYEISSLLQQGANPNQRNSKNVPVIHFTAIHNNVSAARLLIDAGATVGARDGDKRTALIWANMFNHTQFAEMLRNALKGKSTPTPSHSGNPT